MSVLTLAGATTHEREGTRFTSLATPRRGTSETAVWEVEIAPGTPATPHSLTREEVFVVLAGTARVRVGDAAAGSAGPGDAIVVPAGVELELANAADESLRLLCCLPVGGQAVVGGTTFTPPWAE